MAAGAAAATARGGVWLAEDRGAAGAGTIRLNRNENAYGPSAKVITAMQEAAAKAACRYPDVEAEALRHRIAAVNQVTPEHVVLGCGSTDIMRMAVEAFVGSGKNLSVALPTFEAIAGFAQRAGAEVITVALNKD
jgi:histidinol-phosphate aminotransferase